MRPLAVGDVALCIQGSPTVCCEATLAVGDVALWIQGSPAVCCEAISGCKLCFQLGLLPHVACLHAGGSSGSRGDIVPWLDVLYYLSSFGLLTCM